MREGRGLDVVPPKLGSTHLVDAVSLNGRVDELLNELALQVLCLKVR